uniref:Uncharacterized protein n=1 Tax=Aegilops tauschii TaxID=37682 RepID=R7W909_AEGTA
MSGHRIDRLSASDLQAPGAIPVGGPHVAAPAPAAVQVGAPDRPHLVRGVHVQVDVAGEGRVVDGHRDDDAVYGKADNVADVQLVRAPPLPDALGAPFEVPEHGVVLVLDDMSVGQFTGCDDEGCTNKLWPVGEARGPVHRCKRDVEGTKSGS